MRVLFITRKLFPIKGGMERAAFSLYEHLSNKEDLELINGSRYSRILQLFFMPVFFLQSCFTILKKNIDLIYLQDGLLAPLGFMLKIFQKPIVITIHGLDVTYPNTLYQLITPPCIKRLDKVICVSNHTRIECIKRKIPEFKIQVIPNGLSDIFHMNEDEEVLKKKLSKSLKTSLLNKKILLSVGRLIERKGYHWFVENVMPKIVEKNKDIVYVIVGEGAFTKEIQRKVDKNNLNKNVLILGNVHEKMLKKLYNISELLLMPNIPVQGDIEGFGIVALEAGSCGRPVIASKIEGLTDSVKNGINGILVAHSNSIEYVEAISKLLSDDYQYVLSSQKIREYILNTFSWEKIALLYLEEFTQLLK
jgi:glycosyltransferase involved in cell wall biosynthesis